MQIAGMETAEAIDWAIRSGAIGIMVLTSALLIKVGRMLERYETLNKNFPPHRHINGKISYSDEYPPARIEQLQP